jgi:hypothetical protein
MHPADKKQTNITNLSSWRTFSLDETSLQNPEKFLFKELTAYEQEKTQSTLTGHKIKKEIWAKTRKE